MVSSSTYLILTIVLVILVFVVHGADDIGQCQREHENVCAYLYNNGYVDGLEKLYDLVDWSPEDGYGYYDGILEPDNGQDKRCNVTQFPLQPSCHKTCNPIQDERFLEISGLEDIDDQQPNTISLKDVIGDNQTKIDELVCTFGDFQPMTLEQRDYVLTYWNKTELGMDEDLKNASYVLWYAAGQFGKSSLFSFLSFYRILL